jgi:hypothetical protein
MHTPNPVRAIALKRAETSIEAYTGTTGPGGWTIQQCLSCPYIALRYSIPANAKAQRHIDPDDPWIRWGGDAILAASGLISDDALAMCGSTNYSTWVQIPVSPEA